MPLSSLRVMLRLRFIQRIVNPLLPHERFMRASLCEPPAIQHDDPVAELAAAHAVGNVNCCFFADQCISASAIGSSAAVGSSRMTNGASL